MAADYLVSSLQPLVLDGPAPCSAEQFMAQCRAQLPAADAAAVGALLGGADAPAATATLGAWRDLETQLRNAIAGERARLRAEEAARWRRPTAGCSLYWANRVVQAFQEKDPARRDRALDEIVWDAAGELTPAAAPLSVAAVYTYAIRLRLVLRRQAISPEIGNAALDRLTAASKLEL
ncbi:MAG: hypothetical protein ACI4Q3_09835 [Kiritimatiellia bacterium]